MNRRRAPAAILALLRATAALGIGLKVPSINTEADGVEAPATGTSKECFTQ